MQDIVADENEGKGTSIAQDGMGRVNVNAAESDRESGVIDGYGMGGTVPADDNGWLGRVNFAVAFKRGISGDDRTKPEVAFGCRITHSGL
jgi:hypothetical protein